MKLSQMLEELKDFYDTHGDMDCYYASDDEGNNYQQVSWTGSLFYLLESDKETWRPSLIGSDDTEYLKEIEEDGEEVIPVCVVN